jgi:hypothetical protein
VAHLQGRDTGLLLQPALELHHALGSGAAERLVLVQLGVEAFAEHAAVLRLRRRAVDQRARELCLERVEVLVCAAAEAERLAERAVFHDLQHAESAAGRGQAVPQRAEIPRRCFAERRAHGQPLQIPHASEARRELLPKP